MKAMWIAVGIAALAASAPAAADTVVFQQSGTATTLSISPPNLPGAGDYLLEYTSSVTTEMEYYFSYDFHYDIFVAPPPRPHNENLEGNIYNTSLGDFFYGTSFSTTFNVPETEYIFYNAGSEFVHRGVDPGTPLYEERKYENPYFWLSVYGTDFGDSFEYNVKVTRLEATASVPEPATWAVMILGFGAAGASLRRRRSFAL